MKLTLIVCMLFPVWGRRQLWEPTAASTPPSLWPSPSIRRGLAQRGGFAQKRNSVVSTAPSSVVKSNKKQESSTFPAGTASIPAEVFNLIKLIVGAGVLGLPAGIAAFGNHPSALLPSFILFCIIGGLAGYGFALIGAVCAATQARSYRQAWRDAVGDASSWLPATACLLVTCCSVLTNSMIQADTIPSILKAFTGITVSRNTGLLGVTLTVLLPLCLMRELKSLAPFSLIGIFGMIYTSAAMAYRWLSNSYATAEGGSSLVKELAPHLWPKFGTAGWKAIFSPNAAILVAMLSSCESFACLLARLLACRIVQTCRKYCDDL